MSGSITLTINLFGAFRMFADSQPLTLTLPKGVRLCEVRESLKAAMKQKGSNPDNLVDESAFADEKQILPDDAIFVNNAELAILPPVCGG